MKYDVFISYSRRDYVDENIIPDSPVKKILEFLDENEISYWFDKDGIYSGSEFVEVIANAIADSKMMLFVSSEHSNESIYTAGEIFEAIENQKLIIPVRIDDSKYNKKFKLLLNPLDYVDISKADALPELLKAIEIEKARIAKLEHEEALRREEFKKREWRKAVKGEILEQVNELKKLKDTRKALLESIYKKLRSIDVLQKQCPVCDTKTDIETEHCQTCGWFFPALTEIEGLGIEADKSALILAKSRWDSKDTHQPSNFEARLREVENANAKLKKRISDQDQLIVRYSTAYDSLWYKYKEIIIVVVSLLSFMLACLLCEWLDRRNKNQFSGSNNINETTLISDTISSPQALTFDVNGVKFNMIYVKGGSFEMGFKRFDMYHYSTQPRHTVILDNYYIAETEVTQELWQTVMRDNPSSNKGDSLPVNNVSWDDSQVFIRRLNNVTNSEFRLPTEAEWEYAARGGNMSKGYEYSGSDTLSLVRASSGTPVAQKRPNELGIYDMSGSVYEWCSDYYSDRYYEVSSRYNPQGPNKDPGYGHVYRGNRDTYVSCLYFRHASSKANKYIGLRLVLSADTAK